MKKAKMRIKDPSFNFDTNFYHPPVKSMLVYSDTLYVGILIYKIKLINKWKFIRDLNLTDWLDSGLVMSKI